MASETPAELLTEATSLIHRLVEANLAQEGVDRLSILICGHREIARLYVTYMHLHRLLPRYVAAQDLILADEDLNSTMILPALVEEDMAPMSDGLLADEGIEFQPAPDAPRRIDEGKWKKWRWAAAILLPLVSVTVIYELTRSSPTPTQIAKQTPALNTQGPAAQPDNSVAINPVPALPVFSKATLADTISATWAGGQKAVEGAHLPLGKITLESGLARLHFDNNVVAIVHGPAVFEVKSDMELDLKSGSVSVDVPLNAHNFAVVTQSAKVTDLGTEFGVETDTQVGTHVEVFQGKVAASALAEQPGTSPRILTKDQAAKVPQDASSIQPAVLSRESFVRSKEYTIIQQANESSFHRWLAYSYELRHDPTLALYYPLETSPDTNLIPNAALTSFGKFDLSLASQTPPLPRIAQGRWPDKSAVIFDGIQRQRLLLAECPLSETGKLSITAWVNANSRPDWATIAKSRGDTVDGQFSLGLSGNDGDLVARICQVDGTDAQVREGKQNPIPTGQWVFVALTADGEKLRLYRNGAEVAAGPCAAVISNPSIRSLSIGFQPANDGFSTRRQVQGYWNGAIDELALFHRPIPAAEIKRMYEAGKPD